MQPQSFAEITEIKTTLTGKTKRFTCRAVSRTANDAVVLFVSDRVFQVGDLPLPAGTVTLAYYWVDRPYNVYHWMTPDGGTLALYFNIARDTVITERELRWHDLTVDVLLRPGAGPVVLDEDELPVELDQPTRQSIDRACATVLATCDEIAGSVERASSGWFAAVFGKERT